MIIGHLLFVKLSDINEDHEDGVNGDNDPQTGSDHVHLLDDVPAPKAGQARLPLVLHLLLPKVSLSYRTTQVSAQCADWAVRYLSMDIFIRFLR